MFGSIKIGFTSVNLSYLDVLRLKQDIDKNLKKLYNEITKKERNYNNETSYCLCNK